MLTTTQLTTTQNHGAVRVLAFNRPEALNAFNGPMFDAVTAEVLAATDDDTVKVLVITGEGRAFSAGMDLADRPDQANPPEHGFGGMFDALIELPKPLLLARTGASVGFK